MHLTVKLTSKQHRSHHSDRRLNGSSHVKNVQAVNGAFEEKRHANVEHFSSAEKTEGDDNPVEGKR